MRMMEKLKLIDRYANDENKKLNLYILTKPIYSTYDIYIFALYS